MLYCVKAPLGEQVPCVGSSSTLWVPIEGEKAGETSTYSVYTRNAERFVGPERDGEAVDGR
jgi:hypothetical protein